VRRVVCLQTHPVFGAVAANLDRADALLGDERADLVVLPELFATGYAFRDRDEALELGERWPDGPTATRVIAWSARTGGVVVAGFAHRRGDRVWNAAGIAAAGRPLGVYAKVHLFGFERECFDRGEEAFPVHEHEGLRVGVMICFDWMFPEAARSLALAGADVIAHPSNLVLPWCQRAMPVRALENGVFTATANRVGTEHRPPRLPLTFTGGTIVCAPDGSVLAHAPAEGAMRVETTIDERRARDKTLASGNDRLAERRPDLYARASSVVVPPAP
jgi:predicted amidohydrolase